MERISHSCHDRETFYSRGNFKRGEKKESVDCWISPISIQKTEKLQNIIWNVELNF